MRVAVIGAGPAGMACAWQLADLDYQVSLFERMEDLGKQGSGVLLQPRSRSAWA